MPADRVAAADLPALVQPIRAVGLIALAFLIYPAINIARASETLGHTLPPALTTVAAVTVYAWLTWTFASDGGARRLRWLAAGLLVGLGIAAPVAYGQAWLGLLIYGSIGAAWVVPGMPALGAVAALAVTTAVVGVGIGAPAGVVLAITVVTALSGFAAWGIVQLALTNAALRSSQAEVARLAATDERLRLAAELHDRVKQQLFIATMETGAARAVLDTDPVHAAGHLADVERALRQAQGDLAGLITGLHIPAEPRQDLAGALPALVADWSARTGTPTDLQCAGLPALPDDTCQLLLVAVTEALTNVTRHAAATRVAVRVTLSNGQIALTVTDDGRGMQPAGLIEDARTGHGLALLGQRALRVGGHLEVGTAPDGGTALAVHCPTPGQSGGAPVTTRGRRRTRG
ncbi:MAG: histidine kinase [Actinomycetota bacterium]|nr:histidine kinase [Actinomycetota bacterium]